MNLILHVDMNAYFASVEQADNPKLQGKPVAVAGGIGGKRSIVAAASYEAKAVGVKTAMPAWEALRICPELIIVPGNMSKYIRISSEIFGMLTQYTDQMEVFSIDEAFLDISKTQERFGGAITIAKQIKKQIKQRFNITCSIGISFNRFLAKLAGELQKPDGLVLLNPEDIPFKIKDVPVSTLCGVGRKMEKYLEEMGIKTFGQLNQYPREKLVKRFGMTCGEQLYCMGQGKDNSCVRPYSQTPPARSMGHSYSLPKATNDLDKAKSYLLRLAEQVGRRLRKDNYKGNVVHVALGFQNYQYWGKQKKLDQHIDDGYQIYKAGEKILGTTDFPAIRFVGITISGLLQNLEQISLFENAKNKNNLLEAIDRVNDRFGECTIERAAIMHTVLHEKTGMSPPQAYKLH